MLGSLIKWVLVAGALAAAAMAYYMYRQGLNPLDPDDLQHTLSSTKERFATMEEAVKASGHKKESVIYKRKDASGHWYYTNEPPEAGEEGEKLIFRSDTNVLPPLPEDGKK